jgi:basic amino acid/polyamine antiporter, APA family
MIAPEVWVTRRLEAELVAVGIKNASVSQQFGALRQDLRVFDGTAIVVGTIIGSAIFLVPAAIAVQLASPLQAFAAWILGGVLSLFGGLSLAELGAAYPGAGGIYIYLREIYGPLPAFLYGWGLLSMIHSGSIAALAVAFGLYAGHLFSLHAAARQILSVAFIALLTTVNCFGIYSGKLVQNCLTVLKFSGLVLMIVMLFHRGHVFAVPVSRFSLDGLFQLSAPFGIALVAVLWAFEGWHVISFAAGEMKNPRRDLPRCLLYGILVVTLIYILANASYYGVLSSREIAQSPIVASAAIAKAYGEPASRFISILILVSVLGAMNGLVLTGPRVYYAMARDGLFFKRFGRTGGKSGAPIFSLCIQGIWAAVLTWSGTYTQIITYVIFTAWLFYGLTVAGVIVLRWREPEQERPFRMPWYPFVPIVFCLASIGIVLASVIAGPSRALIGMGLVLTGVPVFLLFRYHTTERFKGT